MAKRLTETYLHSLSFPARVLDPIIMFPLPVEKVIALTDFPDVASTVMSDKSLLLTWTDRLDIPLRPTLDGDFQTPLDLSVAANMPATAPQGGNFSFPSKRSHG